MRKIAKDILALIKDEYIERFSFILLFFWAISPIVEYIFKNYYSAFYTYYFIFMIYFVGLSGFVTYIIYIIKNKEKKKWNIKKFIPEILLVILVILAIIATILSKNRYMSIFGDDYRKEGLIIYTMYIGFILLASIIKDSKHIKLFFKTIIISCFTIAFIPILKNNFTYHNFANVFHQFNHYGYYLMINVLLSAFMFIDSKKTIKKIVYLLIYIFLTYLLIKNDTFGSYLAVIITFVCLFIYSVIKKYERKSIILLILLFIITSFTVSFFDIKIGERVNFESTQGLIGKNIATFTSDFKSIASSDNKSSNEAGTGRGLLWKEAINYTLEHPIIGGGMESIKDYYEEKGITYNDRPHNIILQVSSFIGIPGAIIYLALILYIAITNLKIMQKDTLHIMVYFTAMCYFISSMFGNSMYYTSPYFMILLGFLIGFCRDKKKTRLTK